MKTTARMITAILWAVLLFMVFTGQLSAQSPTSLGDLISSQPASIRSTIECDKPLPYPTHCTRKVFVGGQHSSTVHYRQEPNRISITTERVQRPVTTQSTPTPQSAPTPTRTPTPAPTRTPSALQDRAVISLAVDGVPLAYPINIKILRNGHTVREVSISRMGAWQYNTTKGTHTVVATGSNSTICATSVNVSNNKQVYGIRVTCI